MTQIFGSSGSLFKRETHGRMKYYEIGILAGSLAVFLGTPFVPTSVYVKFFSTPLTALLLLTLLLVIVSFSTVGAVGAALAIGALFVEQRRRVISLAQKTVEGSQKKELYTEQIKTAAPVVPSEVHPVPDFPDDTMIKSGGEDQTNEFEAEGWSINHKRDLNAD